MDALVSAISARLRAVSRDINWVSPNCFCHVDGQTVREYRIQKCITPSRVNHNTVINWVRQAALDLPNAPEADKIPEITQIDELETFVGKKN